MSLPDHCPLCEALSPKGPLLVHRDADTQVQYSLYECPECSAQFWWPFRNPGASWYEHDERYADRNQDPILEPNEKHRATLRALTTPGTVLDVGCGVGNFLAYAQARGWKGWGIDFDKDAIAAGKKVFGLTNLEIADLAQFRRNHPDLRFDLVTFFDVFEHLDDHATFLRDVKDLLVPGGYIALSMPYRHGWRWLMPHDFPPRHLTRWDEESLRSVLARQGYSVQEIKRFPASFSFLVMKMRFKYGRWSTIGLVRKAGGAETAGRSDAGKMIKRRALQLIARAKDILLFGIPAFVLWIVLLPQRARYTDFLCIATMDTTE